MCVLALPGQPVPSGMRQRKKDKKKEKRGEEGIQGDQLHATGSLMPVVSLCVEEGCRPRVEIIGGTWVGDARDVGAGGCRRRQDLAMVWPLRLLAKRRRGRARTVFRYVSSGCANAQDWEKRKETRKNEKRKERKKKGKRTHCEPIHQLHATGSSTPAVSLWVEGRGRLRADHRPHAEILGGTWADDGRDVDAGGHRRDLAMAWQLHLLASQG